MFYNVVTSGGWHRVVQIETCDDIYDAMFHIGCAEITAEETTRPAFREIADTLRWEEIR